MVMREENKCTLSIYNGSGCGGGHAGNSPYIATRGVPLENVPTTRPNGYSYKIEGNCTDVRIHERGETKSCGGQQGGEDNRESACPTKDGTMG